MDNSKYNALLQIVDSLLNPKDAALAKKFRPKIDFFTYTLYKFIENRGNINSML